MPSERYMQELAALRTHDFLYLVNTSDTNKFKCKTCGIGYRDVQDMIIECKPRENNGKKEVRPTSQAG